MEKERKKTAILKSVNYYLSTYVLLHVLHNSDFYLVIIENSMCLENLIFFELWFQESKKDTNILFGECLHTRDTDQLWLAERKLRMSSQEFSVPLHVCQFRFSRKRMFYLVSNWLPVDKPFYVHLSSQSIKRFVHLKAVFDRVSLKPSRTGSLPNDTLILLLISKRFNFLHSQRQDAVTCVLLIISYLFLCKS